MKRCCRLKKSRRRPSQEKGEAGEEGEKFLKTEASPKRQRNQIRVLNTGSSRSEHREAEAKGPSSEHTWPSRRLLTFRPLLGAQPEQENEPTGDLRVRPPQESLIPSLQITETRGSPQRGTSTPQGGFLGKKMGLVEKTHFPACCFRQHERRPAKSGLGP